MPIWQVRRVLKSCVGLRYRRIKRTEILANCERALVLRFMWAKVMIERL